MKYSISRQTKAVKLSLGIGVAVVALGAIAFFSPKQWREKVAGKSKPSIQPMFIVQFPLGLREERMKALPGFAKCKEITKGKAEDHVFRCSDVSPLFKMVEVTTQNGVIAKIEAATGNQPKLLENYRTRTQTILGQAEATDKAACNNLPASLADALKASCEAGKLTVSYYSNRGSRIAIYDAESVMAGVSMERPVNVGRVPLNQPGRPNPAAASTASGNRPANRVPTATTQTK